MNGKRAKKIRKTINLLISRDIITEEQRKNAERFFKNAWTKNEWQKVQEAIEADGV